MHAHRGFPDNARAVGRLTVGGGDSGWIQAVLLAACRADVEVFKPGNVSIRSSGHGMDAGDFLTSATVAIPWLVRWDISLGERILGAVDATVSAVGCNTNLGILLLLAPLAEAAMQTTLDEGLQAAVTRVMERLNSSNPESVFAAIRRANPGGLGRAAEHDVFGPVSGTLGAAMQAASLHDRIAHQYVTAYGDIFGSGRQAFERALPGLQVLSVYLEFAGRFPDSHVSRKHGARRAEAVRDAFAEVALRIKACENPPAFAESLEGLDQALKRDNINPGTSADLTVATLAAAALDGWRDPPSSVAAASLTWSDAVFLSGLGPSKYRR